MLGIGPDAYWADVLDVVTLDDFLHGIGKSFIFAILVAMISISLGCVFQAVPKSSAEHNRIGGDLYCRDHRCRYCLCAVALGDDDEQLPSDC